jgi:ferric-dicitrate binding protein FerR (iron transport regulator)
MTLEKGDRISVKPGSSLIVTLKDGTIIDINGGSDVVIMNDGIIINSGSIAVIEGSITVLNSKTQESYSLFSGQGISFNKDGKTSGVQPLSKDYAGEVAPSPSVPERPEKPASRI